MSSKASNLAVFVCIKSSSPPSCVIGPLKSKFKSLPKLNVSKANFLIHWLGS